LDPYQSTKSIYPLLRYNGLIQDDGQEQGYLTMAGRKKRLPPDARPITISLGGKERLALQVIEVRRQSRAEQGDSPSEIVSDALWHYFESVEKMSREQIQALLPDKAKDQNQSNLKHFPKKKGS
jgi:hypothetical protein